jgi:RNA polymerase sigma-70 factor (ECF subfamily)
MRIDDPTLIASARAGAPEALAALYRRYWPLAWQWAYALTGERARADDLAQDAVLRAFRALHSFDEQRPFGPWLKRILLNLGADELRRLRSGPLPDEWMSEWRVPSAPESAVPDELRDAVRSLAPARRLVLVLHYWVDLSLDEIAALLDVPFGTVASRLSRARADVRRALEEANVV